MKKYLVIFLLCYLLPVAGFADYESTEVKKSQWLEAAREGSIATIKSMLLSGFNIETRSDSGNSALKIASKKNHIELANFLIKHHADINSHDWERGRTPLHSAAYNGHLEIVRMLLQHGAVINLKTTEGNTSLNLAALKNHPAIIRLLLQAGAKLEFQNNKGRTPLFQAAQNNSVAATQILLANGANPLMVDNTGDNVIQQAAGKSSDIVLGSVNKTSVIFNLPKSKVNDNLFTRSTRAVLLNRGWTPEQKSEKEFFAFLKNDERIFRIHLERIGDNLLIEYIRGYGSNKENLLNNIKNDLLLTLKGVVIE